MSPFSLQFIIIYIGLILILFFLIKGFVKNCLNNTQILILIFIIVLIVIFVCSQSCMPNVETYSPINSLAPLSSSPDSPMQPGCSMNRYNDIIRREQMAMNKIRSKYQNDMVYTESHPFNTVPLGAQLYDYTYLPPENWFRPYEQPHVCTSNNRYKDYYTPDKSICGLMEFETDEYVGVDEVDNGSGVITEKINVDYIKNVINKCN